MEIEIRITGSMVQAYTVCPRQAWLTSRQICPDEDNVYLALGRLIDQQSYGREKKKFAWAISAWTWSATAASSWLSENFKNLLAPGRRPGYSWLFTCMSWPLWESSITLISQAGYNYQYNLSAVPCPIFCRFYATIKTGAKMFKNRLPQ